LEHDPIVMLHCFFGHSRSTDSVFLVSVSSIKAMNMDIGECGNDRPGFGVNSVSQKLRSYNYKMLLELLEFLRRWYLS
jgi:hypothetical protein